MTKLSRISQIDPASLELLDAAGYADIGAIASSSVDALTKELARAHSVLKIGELPPSRERISEWIRIARGLVGLTEEPVPAIESLAPYEPTPQKLLMLEKAQFAIPLQTRILIDQNVPVSEIPVGILFSEYTGEGEIRGETKLPASKVSRPTEPSRNVLIADPGAVRGGLDSLKFKSMDEVAGTVQRQSLGPVTIDSPRETLIRAPLRETNAGRSSKSRFYIRGVLHDRPVGMVFGSLSTIASLVLFPVAMVSSILLLLSQEQPEKFGWVPGWVIVFPACLPILGLIYLIMGTRCGCRVCGQKLFLPKLCLKSSKAHHVFGLGYILPTVIHMLVFRWFRCIYCGTPIRLKK